MSIIQTAPREADPDVPKCGGCKGNRTVEQDYGDPNGGGDYGTREVRCPTCEGTGQDQAALRLAVIARFAALIHPEARAESTLGMLRDAQAEIDRLHRVLLVKRAEALLEAAEVLKNVGHWPAAEVLEEYLARSRPGA